VRIKAAGAFLLGHSGKKMPVLKGDVVLSRWESNGEGAEKGDMRFCPKEFSQ